MNVNRKPVFIIFMIVSLVIGGFTLPTGGQEAPTAFAEGSEPGYDKVVHITWDGFYNELYNLAKQNQVATPYLDQLVESGMRLTNHLTTVPSVEAAHYSAMTGAYPRTTGNTYKYFDGSSVLGLNSKTNYAQTLTQAMQGQRTALVINENAVSEETADTYTYLSTSNRFADSVTEAVYQISVAGQPDYVNIYSNDLYMHMRSSVIADQAAFTQDLIAIVGQLDLELGKLIAAVNQYGDPERTVYVLSSHSGISVTETKKQTALYSVLNNAGFTVKEVSTGSASGEHALVAIKNYEAKYMQLRFNHLAPDQVSSLVALIESQDYVADVLERSELDALGVHPMFADLLVIPKEGYSFCPASVGVSRPDSFEDSSRYMFGVISGPKLQELNKTGRVTEGTSIVDLAPTIASMLGIPAPVTAEGRNLLTVSVQDSYVLYVNWDGFAYHWYELANQPGSPGTPHLNALLQDGVLFSNARTGIPSITGSMQQAIVSGAWPVDTGNSYRYYDTDLNRVIQYGRENVLENIAEAAAKRNISIAGVNSWYFQDRGMFAGNENQPYIEAGGLSGFTERVNEAIKIIKGEPVVSGGKTITFAKVPRFLAVYGDDIDSVGHNEHDTRDDEVLSTSVQELREAMARTVSRMDADLGRLVQALKDRGIYDQTTIFLTTDHGMAMYGAESTNVEDAIPPATSSLPDLEATIAAVGQEFRGEDYEVETVYREGEGAQPETEIVITSVGLQAQIKFLIPMEKAVIHRIVDRVMEKEYYGAHLFKEELIKRGAPAHFADVLISPKPPYNFKTGDPSSVRVVRGQHDSLDDSAQHIFTMISGEAVQKGITYDNKIYNIDISPTMARVLGFEGPSGATGIVLDDVLAAKYQGPALALSSPASEDVMVSERMLTVSGTTSPNAVVKINDQEVGKADGQGLFTVQHSLTEGLNRVIVEVVSDGRETRKVLFSTYLVSRQELTQAIEEARALYEAAVEGNEEGQYKPGSKAELKAAITEATLVEEKIEAVQEQLDTASASLRHAMDAFKKGKRTGAVHLFGEVLLNGASPDGTVVTITNGDNSVVYTAKYGEAPGQTSMGQSGVTEVSDPYGNVVGGRLLYYFDVPKGTYTVIVTNGSQSAVRTMTTTSASLGELPWGAYNIEKAQDVMLSDAYSGENGKAFVLTDGQLKKANGIQASVTIRPSESAASHKGNEIVLFQLLRGTEPSGILAVEKDIRAQERVSVHFNVSGNGYRVKVYVVDRHTNSVAEIGSSLADPITLE